MKEKGNIKKSSLMLLRVWAADDFFEVICLDVSSFRKDVIFF
jgi:hypothetical protein